MASGDHFSGVAANYAAFRPGYPAALFDFVASIAPSRARAWDCGAGSGQATLDLAERFDRVIATDISAEQVSRAPAHPRIEWHVAPAEKTPIAGASIDATIVAQALHWFDHDAFYAELRRVSVANGVIVAWTYAAPRMQGDVGERLHEFMFGELGPYWPAERKYVDEEYRTIPFPFERIAAPSLRLEDEWPRERVVGYLRSMSATARYAKARGMDPVAPMENALREAWPDGEPRGISWPLIVIAGRIG